MIDHSNFDDSFVDWADGIRTMEHHFSGTMCEDEPAIRQDLSSMCPTLPDPKRRWMVHSYLHKLHAV